MELKNKYTVGRPEYQAWCRVKLACYSKNSQEYKNFGGLGIGIAKDWLSNPKLFFDYLGPRPSSRHRLKRLDVSKDFEPGNVFWFDSGDIKTAEYAIWNKIKGRCYNKKDPRYDSYGGRGIVVDESWLKSFHKFYMDVGPRPSIKHSIDRIDNNRGYEPGNIRWATHTQQARNKRNNKIIQICCQSKPLSEWLEIHKVDRGTYYYRQRKGLDTLRIFGLVPKLPTHKHYAFPKKAPIV